MRLAKAKRSFADKILVIELILVSGLIVWALGYNLFSQQHKLIKQDQYQAVFLENGQVYFGHLKNLGGSYVELQDTHYLQQTGTSNATSTLPSGEAKLVKIGNEPHGPENSLFIGKDKILFWENLTSSSKISQLINQQ